MKKKILFLLAVSMLLVGTVSAATSLWGTYKGNEIIRLQANGKTLNTKDVPAISYNQRTMIPLYMLNDLGINYTWDQKTKTVIMSTSNIGSTSSELTIEQIAQKTSSFVSTASFNSTAKLNGKSLSVYLIDTLSNLSDSNFDTLLKLSVDSNSKILVINDYYNNSLSFYVSDISKYLSKQITMEQLFNNGNYAGSGNSNNTSSNTNSSVQEKQMIKLYSNDLKVFLGDVDPNSYALDSIFNQYGNYGSQYGLNSIFNEYGTYGGKYSNKSAFNKYATEPPAIVKDGKVIGYLTINKNIKNGMSFADLVNLVK